MLIDGATVDLEQENQRLQAELRAQTQELRGSRARLVAVGDAERRRLERDLHDGAQSRFAGVALQLRLAQRKAPPDSELARMLDAAIGELYAGIEELRELARGIHPAVLTQRGLEAALESLASRAPLPVDLRATLEGRLPMAVEMAAYFAVSEALANVVKHARAGLVAIDVRVERGRLVIDVADDGRGGASAGAGSGLSGLADRVGALDGRVEIDSPLSRPAASPPLRSGAGTRVHVEIPLSPCRRVLRGG
jgi:signal transduction histidine kinase